HLWSCFQSDLLTSIYFYHRNLPCQARPLPNSANSRLEPRGGACALAARASTLVPGLKGWGFGALAGPSFTEARHEHEKDRHKGDGQKGRGEHAAKDHGADGLLAGGAGAPRGQ